jgi:hypothetical protein
MRRERALVGLGAPAGAIGHGQMPRLDPRRGASPARRPPPAYKQSPRSTDPRGASAHVPITAREFEIKSGDC